MTTWIDMQDQEKVNRNLSAARNANTGGWNHYLSYAGNDERFALWLAYADRRVTKMVGVSLFDLEDALSRDAFDSGMSPKEFALEALENDSLYSEMF